MCIRDSTRTDAVLRERIRPLEKPHGVCDDLLPDSGSEYHAVSYTHLRAHETVLDLVCRLLLEKKKQKL